MSNLPMSKDEILEKNNAGGAVADKKYRQLFGHRERLYEAMDEYAKQEAIAAIQYILDEHMIARDKNFFDVGKHLTPEQIYEQYQQQKKGK